MIETALFIAPRDKWLSANDVINSFKDIAGLQTLQIKAVIDGLSRLTDKKRVEVRKTAPQFSYRLFPVACDDLQQEFNEASSRLDRVLTQLYGNIAPGKDPQSFAPFFLEFVCDFFSHLGAQWADYLGAERSRAPVAIEAIEKMIEKKAEKHRLDEAVRPTVVRRTLHFFQHRDPDFDYLKFSLGQSFYVARLLGMEGKDYLTREIFATKTLFLDSSVVIPALISSSRHYEVFRDLQKICQRLNIRLCVARPTVDEVRKVAAAQREMASTLYERVPESLGTRVRGDFFQAFLALKENKPDAKPDEVFESFQEVAETIRTNLGAEVIDDKEFETIPYRPDFNTTKDVFQEASKTIRHVPKGANALAHDATIFLFLDAISEGAPDQTWMVSRDASLPRAWSRLQTNETVIRAFLLDGLLQCISPFVVEEDIKSFSELFAEAIRYQLLPQSRLFDIDDFMLFQDIELDCRELTDDEVQEGLHRVKQHVLHGASYRHEDLAPAAYELRRFFSKRRDTYESLAAERERLESTIATLQRATKESEQQHSDEMRDLNQRYTTEVSGLQQRLDEFDQRENLRATRRRRWLTATKKAVFWLGLLAMEVEVARAALRFGEGGNWALKISSFSAYLSLSAIGWTALMKITLFRRQKLRDVFPNITEIREFWNAD